MNEGNTNQSGQHVSCTLRPAPANMTEKPVVQIFYDSTVRIHGRVGGYRARLKNRIVVHDCGVTAKDAYDNFRRTAVTFGYPAMAPDYTIELI